MKMTVEMATDSKVTFIERVNSPKSNVEEVDVVIKEPENFLVCISSPTVVKKA